MIGTIEIKCHAAKPQMPLPPIFAFKGSPQSLRLLDVPRRIGEWQITAVKVAASYPNNSILVQEAVRTGNVWVATFGGCETSGKVANGLQIIADGKDEQGDAVTGYVLGCGDLYILDRDSSIAADDSKWYVRYCDETPATPAKGDLEIDNGAVMVYDGANWISLAGADGKVDKAAFHTFDDCELSDVATQREVRETVQSILGKLKNLATGLAAMSALAVYAIDDNTTWEDVPPTNTVKSVVQRFSPVPGNYETVSNRAMQISMPGDEGHLPMEFEPIFKGKSRSADSSYSVLSSPQGNSGSIYIANRDLEIDGGLLLLTAWPRMYAEHLGFQWLATEDYVRDSIPDLSEYAKMYAVNAVSNRVTSMEGIVNNWETYWGGSNVVFEVTNYYGNSSGELPRLRIREYRDGAWTNVWDEINKFKVCEKSILGEVAKSNAALRASLEGDFAPRAWGTVTDKGSENHASNTVWMTSPETYFAGGTEYQRVAVGSGSICVLVDNGALARTTGEPGTFRFQDDGGTNFFGFAKSDSYTIGCRTDGITVNNGLVTLRYDVIMGGEDVPIIYWSGDLRAANWVRLNNADGTAADGAPYTVTWFQEGGSYFAAINCSGNASGFFRAETSVAGDVVWETNMRARLGGGIECTNTVLGVMGVIRPSYNGSAVIWTWSAR